MSEEKKEGGCCSTSGSTGCCSGGGKKLFVGLVLGALLFAAGMMFAKMNCSSNGAKVCPMSGAPMK